MDLRKPPVLSLLGGSASLLVGGLFLAAWAAFRSWPWPSPPGSEKWETLGVAMIWSSIVPVIVLLSWAIVWWWKTKPETIGKTLKTFAGTLRRRFGILPLVLMLSLCVLQVGIRVSREFSPISWWTLSAGLLVGAAIGWKQRFRRVPALQVVTSMGFITILGLIMENVFMSGGPWKQSAIERGILGVRDTVIQIVVWGGIAWIASWLLVGRKSTHPVG